MTLTFDLQLNLTLTNTYIWHWNDPDLGIWPWNDPDLDENFAAWCHCIISYYEQFEVFDLEMTLTFGLQLNVTLTNASQHFIRRK